jgi:hypothetical protein
LLHQAHFKSGSWTQPLPQQVFIVPAVDHCVDKAFGITAEEAPFLLLLAERTNLPFALGQNAIGHYRG